MANKHTNGNIKDRIELAKQICRASQIYDKFLVGKTFMYVFDNRYIEVVFRKKDFSHLTGVETSLYAEQFYKIAIKNKLQHTQFRFSQRHPHNLSVKKINQLLTIDKIINEEMLILETLQTKTTTYKFGITELEFTVCMDKDLNTDGSEKSHYFIAKSLRIEDSFNRGINTHEVNMILSKPNNEKLYNEITYIDTGVIVETLPEPIKSKINISSLALIVNAKELAF